MPGNNTQQIARRAKILEHLRRAGDEGLEMRNVTEVMSAYAAAGTIRIDLQRMRKAGSVKLENGVWKHA